MGIEHLAAVLDHSKQAGSSLVVLLVVASYSDQRGEWIVDQATLQRRARLSRRRAQQILADLVNAGELAVASHHGRGKISTYRLLVGPENAQQSAPFPKQKGEAPCTFSEPKREAECTFSAEKRETECTFPPSKGETGGAFPAPKGAAECVFSVPPSPPFPPDPQIPPYPPKATATEAEKKADMESFALAPRPLSGPQSATFRTKLLLEEAGVPLPSPAQIGVWVRTLGGVEPLLDLLRRLIQAGLATKKNPAAYVHRVVLERAERPEPARPLDARAGREILRAAGADEARWLQAQEIMANVEKI